MKQNLKQELVIRHSDRTRKTINKGSDTDKKSVASVADPKLSDSKRIVGRGFKSHYARSEAKEVMFRTQ